MKIRREGNECESIRATAIHPSVDVTLNRGNGTVFEVYCIRHCHKQCSKSHRVEYTEPWTITWEYEISEHRIGSEIR